MPFFLVIDTDAPPVWTIPGSCWCLTILICSSWLVNRHLDRTIFTPLRSTAVVESPFHQDQVMEVPYQPWVVPHLAEWNEGSSQTPTCGRLSTSSQPGITSCACAAKQRQDFGYRGRKKVTGSVTLNTGAQRAWMGPTTEMALFGMRSGNTSSLGSYLHYSVDC